MGTGEHGYATPAGASAWGRPLTIAIVVAAALAVWGIGSPGVALTPAPDFVQDDLPALVLGEGDAPEGAALTETSGFEDVEGALEQTIIGGARAQGLEAAYTNNFLPWSGSRDLQSTAMLFPEESTAAQALSTLAAANDMTAEDSVGEEGAAVVYNAGEDQWVFAQLWRRSNALLFLLMMEPAPDLPFADADLSIVEEMDAKAVAVMQAKAAPEDAGAQAAGAASDDGGSPLALIAIIIGALLILGAAAAFVILRRRPAADPGAPPAAPQAAPAPAATATAPAETDPGVKYCTNCGTPEEDADARFCQSCGNPFG